MWTNHERQSAQARSLQQQDYILPIKIDDTDIPGLRTSKGHMDVRQDKLPAIADTAIKILHEEHPQLKTLSPDTKAKLKNPLASSRGVKQSQPKSLVLLGEHFYREVRYKESGDTITVHVKPKNSAEESRLRRLHGTAHRGFNASLAFAYRLNGGRAHLQNVEHLAEQGKPLTVVALRLEPAVRQSAYLGQDAQASLERKVKWVLFGEMPSQQERYSNLRLDAETEARFDEGIVRKAWERWQGSKADFQVAAKLLLVFHLRQAGTVSHISKLEVGPWRKQVLPIRFRGTQDNAFASGELIIDVSGEIELAAKPRRG